jgi:low affinity Fe/Cu permease
MPKNESSRRAHFFERFAGKATAATGSTSAFLIAVGLVIAWAITGPFFHYSETWQLVINTGTTIITFLMVFLIQKAQNKDSLAIQLKLNELVASHELASNRLVNVEGLTEDELRVLKDYYCSLNELTKKDSSLNQSHSIEESQMLHEFKKNFKRRNKMGSGYRKPERQRQHTSPKSADRKGPQKNTNNNNNSAHGSSL